MEKRLEAALGREKHEIASRIKIDSEIETKIVVLTCSDAPEGYSQWTLRLLAGKVVELGIIESVLHTAIGNCLKNESKPWLQEQWCIPNPSAEFVERMENVLEVYNMQYDPLRPVVCTDETNRQLIGEVLRRYPR